jgi:hypothetical protein
MNRQKYVEELKKQPDKVWDIIVIGGGATGLGVAHDGVSRGYKTLLLEQSDFAKATSSRSTKLVHGGVRYMAHGDLFLVMEALHERRNPVRRPKWGGNVVRHNSARRALSCRAIGLHGGGSCRGLSIKCCLDFQNVRVRSAPRLNRTKPGRAVPGWGLVQTTTKCRSSVSSIEASARGSWSSTVL